jgi:pimeloyl-ACP methyl ester carboxylesterase
MTADTLDRARSSGIRNVVLVHGAFADGAGWEGLHGILAAEGYKVAVVQHPTRSFAEDVGYVSRAIAAMDGPVVLVGHSYGGAVITEAGRVPKVKSLVYIAGWVPDAGQSVLSLIGSLPAGSAQPPILPPQDGFIIVDPERFPDSFAQDVEAGKARFMAIAQVPWGLEAASGTVSEPAWKFKPSWYLLTTEDRMIPPEGQRAMASHAGMRITEVAGSHAVFVSRPDVVASLVEEAAQAAMTDAV